MKLLMIMEKPSKAIILKNLEKLYQKLSSKLFSNILIINILLLLICLLFFCCQKKPNFKENNYPIQKNNSKKTLSLVYDKEYKSIKTLCEYDNQVSSLGIGLVIAPSTFDIYKDSLLSSKIKHINMYNNDNEINFCSKFFKPDYGIMHFICISRNSISYKILVNFSDILYLPVKKGYKFKSWDNYIYQSFGIRRKINKGTTNLLRSNPSDNSIALDIPKGLECFCPMKINGNWVQVKYDCFYNKEDNPYEGLPCYQYIMKCKKPLTGWLKWRDKNKLLIDIFLTP